MKPNESRPVMDVVARRPQMTPRPEPPQAERPQVPPPTPDPAPDPAPASPPAPDPAPTELPSSSPKPAQLKPQSHESPGSSNTPLVITSLLVALLLMVLAVFVYYQSNL